MATQPEETQVVDGTGGEAVQEFWKPAALITDSVVSSVQEHSDGGGSGVMETPQRPGQPCMSRSTQCGSRSGNCWTRKKRIASNMKSVPEIDAWQQKALQPDQLRKQFLVLTGPSQLGKTEYVRSLFTVGGVLESNGEGLQHVCFNAFQACHGCLALPPSAASASTSPVLTEFHGAPA